jgi:hypothetical protein
MKAMIDTPISNTAMTIAAAMAPIGAPLPGFLVLSGVDETS